MNQKRETRDKTFKEQVITLDIGEEESPFIIEPFEDPIPHEAPIPEREREEEVPT